ncbi:MAG: DNA translocase FtsK 4TM domain-containing protein [Pseudomonadota bacterium]|nr:DNA translocase FtsK 4TM domain-containing protein [Pseudomonadota bacterium]
MQTIENRFIRKDVGFILYLVMALFLSIALMSYHASDPAFYHQVKGYVVANWEGYLGAHIAALFFYFLGYGAYVLPLALLYKAITCLRGNTAGEPKAYMGILALYIGCLGLMSLHIAHDDSLPVGIGGYLGDQITWQLTDWVDIVGSTLVLSGLAIVGFTVVFQVAWEKLFSLQIRRPKKPIEMQREPVEVLPKKRKRPVSAKLKKNKDPELSPELLNDNTVKAVTATPQEKEQFSKDIEDRLQDFGIEAHVVGVLEGPVVTRYEVALAAGTKVSRISTISKDLARSLSVVSVRIVEVIPGKAVIGLEFPNKSRQMVTLKEIIASNKFKQAKSPLTLALGRGISGDVVCADLAKMPHLLVAGTTGSGKSVGLNAMLLSMLYKSSPEELRLILIDPKMLELSAYADIPHLLTPVVTNMEEAAGTLRWCVAEMERRYQLMASLGVRNIASYNEKVKNQSKTKGLLEEACEHANGSTIPHYETLPYIVVVADEFADMMMVVGKKVEQLIARLAQKARAAGIHIILATQRPSVDVITGLIKANIPCRIAFQTSSRIDSRTILDQQGSEALLGHGDMLYLPSGTGVPTRVHGAFVSDDEVHQVTDEIKKLGEPKYISGVTAPLAEQSSDDNDSSSEDALFKEACEEVVRNKKVSISSVQRRFRIGYNRAANLVESMEKNGVVSGPEANGQRRVLIESVDQLSGESQANES